ncbi:MAG: adenosylcobinamide amidohydrolase [Dehalogenimonas sp.]
MVIENELKRVQIGSFDEFDAETVYYKALGYQNDVFTVRFPEPREVISSRHGIMQAKMLTICHIPNELGLFMHDQSKSHFYYYGQLLADVLEEFAISIEDTAFLSTGVQMRNLAYSVERYEELWVACFCTAGVKNNALRIGKDAAVGMDRNGVFKSFGTICHVVVSNASFDHGALVSSMITVTEAKNVALQEMDIRSSKHPEWLATGTGTDQIIVASGFGEKCRYVQGHQKIGEMMAKAVIRSTKEAVANSIRGVGEVPHFEI